MDPPAVRGGPMHLISASRRTDIPAFYADWFLERIRAGSVSWPHPFGGRMLTASLLPEKVAAIVFWTRNFIPMERHLPELEARGYRYLVHFTVTSLPRLFETHVPAPEEAVRQLRRLSERIGPGRLLWRYDPILVTAETGPEFHLRAFERLAVALAGFTRQCSISFVQIYGKVRSSFEKRGLPLPGPDPDLRRSLAARLGEIGAGRGIAVKACCSDELLGPCVEKGRCVDRDQVEALWPGLDCSALPSPTREQCGCARSWDVGIYDTCLHGCSYCYATRDRKTAVGRHRRHDPLLEAMLPMPEAPSSR
jgi:uncharacterized protein DUF1848